MAYSRTITREHRTAYLLLLDISVSMQEVIEHDGRPMLKGECMVDAANKILEELHLRAFRDGEMRDYYDVAVIGYSGSTIHSMLPSSSIFVPITELDSERGGCYRLKWMTPFDIDSGYSGVETTILAKGNTPMHEAIYLIYEQLKGWCERPENFDSAPPMVFHITDGHATDGSFNDIIDICERVMSLSTNDGNVLMFNIHLSPMDRREKMLFPTESELATHPNAFFRAMGRASSPMPSNFVPLIHQMRGSRSGELYRGVGYNVSVVDMISMMNIGTLSVAVR